MASFLPITLEAMRGDTTDTRGVDFAPALAGDPITDIAVTLADGPHQDLVITPAGDASPWIDDNGLRVYWWMQTPPLTATVVYHLLLTITTQGGKQLEYDALLQVTPTLG